MSIIDNIKDGASAVAGTISNVAQNLIEKNRLNAQLNRLRIVIKREGDLINRAYVSLGKYYYNKEKEIETNEIDTENLIKVIDNSKQCIKKAQAKYSELVENENNNKAEAVDDSEVEDITVACSNESEYEDIPFDKAKQDLEDAVIDIEKTAEELVKEREEEIQEKIESLKVAGSKVADEAKSDIKETAKHVADDAESLKADIKNKSDEISKGAENMDAKGFLKEKFEEAKKGAEHLKDEISDKMHETKGRAEAEKDHLKKDAKRAEREVSGKMHEAKGKADVKAEHLKKDADHLKGDVKKKVENVKSDIKEVADKKDSI